MALIKSGFLALLVATTFNTQACDKPITFQAGPFFSTSRVIKYWQPFVESVGAISKCKTNITTAPAYDDYLNSILNKENDIYVVPDHYVSALQNLGLKAILSSYKTEQLYLMSRHPIDTGDLTSLHGDIITVPSKYTLAYLVLKAWLIKNTLLDKVTFDFNHSHDSAALLMLKGKRSSTVILASIYDKLPDLIKGKYHMVKLKVSAGAYIMTKQDLDPAIITAMIKSADKLQFHKWYKTTDIPKEPYSDEFKAQLNGFIKASSL
jgi:ABC-type phosphate/phosphonate transport system substrate-binding protein